MIVYRLIHSNTFHGRLCHCDSLVSLAHLYPNTAYRTHSDAGANTPLVRRHIKQSSRDCIRPQRRQNISNRDDNKHFFFSLCQASALLVLHPHHHSLIRQDVNSIISNMKFARIGFELMGFLFLLPYAIHGNWDVSIFQPRNCKFCWRDDSQSVRPDTICKSQFMDT